MASIDKLALTCRLLYDQRVLEQRKEVEMLKMKLFFRDFTQKDLKNRMERLNFKNVCCKCSGCNQAGRFLFGNAGKEAVCTFIPWFDNVLHERGLVVLRTDSEVQRYNAGPYADELGEKLDYFIDEFNFSDDDCHLIEIFDPEDPDVRTGAVCIGKRVWNSESINDQGIKQFERVFSPFRNPKLSSPPTPPTSPRVAPQPTTIAINQGLELQALKVQLATQAAETQSLKEQLATQAAEMQVLKECGK
jgi:hypothetical protein